MNNAQEEQARLLIESNKEAYEKIEMSMEVQAFLQSKVGRMLIQRAEAQRDDAISELCNCDAADADKVRELQFVIRRSESIQFWMAECIQEGIHASEVLQAQDRSEQNDEQ